MLGSLVSGLLFATAPYPLVGLLGYFFLLFEGVLRLTFSVIGLRF